MSSTTTPSADSPISDSSNNMSVIELSHYAQRHLDSAQGKLSARSSQVNANPIFTRFLRLPQELRDKIWKMYIQSNPRVVEIRYFKFGKQTPCYLQHPILEINKQLREQAITEYGYQKLSFGAHPTSFNDRCDNIHYAPSRPDLPNWEFTFHPDVDMLYVSDSFYTGREDDQFQHICKQLKPTGLLDNIRTLAVGNLAPGVGRLVSACRKLELLLFVIVGAYDYHNTDQDVQLEITFSDRGRTRGIEILPVNHFWWESGDNIVDGFKSDLLDEWRKAQGEGRPLPRFEFAHDVLARI